MLIAAVLSITLRARRCATLLIRGKHPRRSSEHPVSRAIIRGLRAVRLRGAAAARRRRSRSALFALVSAVPLALQARARVHAAAQRGRHPLHADHAARTSRSRRPSGSSSGRTAILRSVPRGRDRLRQGRAAPRRATDPAPLSMVETTVQLQARDDLARRVHARAGIRRWAPGAGSARARARSGPRSGPITRDELIAEMNAALQLPGWTNALTMPIKTRIDMLSTGVRTPVGIKVFGTDLDEIERAGDALEHAAARRCRGTRSVLYERNAGRPLRRHRPASATRSRATALQVADVQRRHRGRRSAARR